MKNSKLISKALNGVKLNGTYFLSDDDEYIRINWGDGKGSNVGRAKTGDSFYKDGHAAIGHAANLIVKDDGTMYVYEYGRYNNPSSKSGYYIKKGHGNVLYRKLNLNAKNYIKDGKLDEDAMLNAVAKSYFDNGSLSWRRTGQSAEETEALWDELGRNKDRSSYSGIGNNCVSTAARLSGATQRPLGTTAGNDGFWIPVQGQAIAQRPTLRSKGTAGNEQTMFNDVLTFFDPQVAQMGVDVINTGVNAVNEYIVQPVNEHVILPAVDGTKKIIKLIGNETGWWKNGGKIYKKYKY